MKMVPNSPMFYSVFFIIVCVGVRLPFADGRPAGGRRVCVRVVVVINFLLFCPTFSAVLSIRSYHSI